MGTLFVFTSCQRTGYTTTYSTNTYDKSLMSEKCVKLFIHVKILWAFVNENAERCQSRFDHKISCSSTLTVKQSKNITIGYPYDINVLPEYEKI